MKKKDLFLILDANEKNEITSEVREFIKKENERYAMNMYQLQSKAGLTFKEAQAYLMSWRGLADIIVRSLAEIHAIYNLQRRAKKKIADSGLTLEEIFGEYHPMKAMLRKYPLNSKSDAVQEK